MSEPRFETLQRWADAMPLCDVCETRHDPRMSEAVHIYRKCDMCGSVHRAVDFCPPAAPSQSLKE